MTSNQINYAKLAEDRRHNRVTEGQTDTSIRESVRHNKESERLGWGNIGLGYSNLGELMTHNRAIENIQQAGVEEDIRHNKETEGIQQKKNTIEGLKMGSRPIKDVYAGATLAGEGFKLLEPASKNFVDKRSAAKINKNYVGAR